MSNDKSKCMISWCDADEVSGVGMCRPHRVAWSMYVCDRDGRDQNWDATMTEWKRATENHVAAKAC